jgi:hypothetical protein
MSMVWDTMVWDMMVWDMMAGAMACGRWMARWRDDARHDGVCIVRLEKSLDLI